ncbi:hypothetical protein DPMN_175809 [Dreissena polymorpha]|uniref:Uncharacterized protein n=1 Tax=Dreissena polymorpha TaxID=45954 RepID=A0A9D4IJ38_DREPO|nr:hypothetical protein DPMN_175809 [Dreissena polymorpha]
MSNSSHKFTSKSSDDGSVGRCFSRAQLRILVNVCGLGRLKSMASKTFIWSSTNLQEAANTSATASVFN